MTFVLATLFLLFTTTYTFGYPLADEPRNVSPVWKRSLLGEPEGKKRVTFNHDGTFKVISFSDMHFGERNGDGTFAAWGPEQDANTTRVHSVILDFEKPDFVVFNGDHITGENVLKFNATGYLDEEFGPTVQRGLPFASTHGNHDNANNITHEEEIIYEMEHYSNLSYTRMDVGPKPYGPGNYWVPVFVNEDDRSPAMIMWFFDSRSFVSGTGDGPGTVPAAANYYWVDEETVPPYIQAQAELMEVAYGTLPPSLIFVHIPVNIAQSMAPLPTEGDHDDDDPVPATQGWLNSTDYTGLDLVFFNAVATYLDQGRGKVLAMTSGHDHGDSWCARTANSSGIPICFDGHSGYGGYVTTNSEVRNGRVFTVNVANLSNSEKPYVWTYNSYENLTINDEIALDAAYMASYL